MAVTPRRIGLLTPFRELPGEFVDVVAEAREPAISWQVVTLSDDSHEIASLHEMADEAALAHAVERLRRWRPTVVAWACTSGSFVLGRAGALAQARAIEAAAGVPATSTSLAFVEALSALDVGEVSLLSPYPEPATDSLIAFLAEWDVSVRSSTWLGRPGGLASEQLRAADVELALEELDLGVPVLFPDTAVWGFEIYRELAPRLGQTLLVANQVTLWHAFDLAGMATDVPAFGALSGLLSPAVTTVSARPEGA